MFAIISHGQILGYSELEQGDPPMGVAFGRFIPAEDFEVFVRTVSPDIADRDDVQIWNKLSAKNANGIVLECAAVAISRYHDGDELACEVEVLGITKPPYEDMFPHHVAAYELQFRP